MRAIIIQDVDAVALIDQLSLKAHELQARFGQQSLEQARVADEAFRMMRHVVVNWLQDHGAKVI